MVFSTFLSYIPIFKSEDDKNAKGRVGLYTEGDVVGSFTKSEYGTINSVINAGYVYDHYTCTPDATLNYNNENNTFSVTSKVATKCDLYFRKSLSADDITLTNFDYDGTEKSTTVTVVYHNNNLLENTDYTVSGTRRATNAGTYSLFVTYMGNTIEKTWKIRAVPNLTFNPTSYYFMSNNVGQGTYISYDYDGDGTVTCEGDEYVSCEVDNTNKTLYIVYYYSTNAAEGHGDRNVIVSAAATNNYAGVNTTFVVTTCLDPETLVTVWDRKKKKKGKKKIKDITLDDMVYTYDNITNTYKTAKVKAITINPTKELVHLIFEDDEIITTKDHPFCVKEVGYMEAGLLKAGFEIIGADCEIYKLVDVQVEYLDKPKDMYCLELESGKNSFLVGKNGIVALSIYAAAHIALSSVAHRNYNDVILTNQLDVVRLNYRGSRPSGEEPSPLYGQW